MSPSTFRFRFSTLCAAGLALGLVFGVPAMADRAEAIGPLSANSSSIDWTPKVAYETLTLVVNGPDGSTFRQEFKAGQTPSFSAFGADGNALPDGLYTYQMVAAPVVSPSLRAQFEDYAASNSSTRGIGEVAGLPNGLTQSGAFTIFGGTIIDPFLAEQTVERSASASPSLATRDQVIADDLIVNGGSACIGQDCVNGESFGFDTLRLKENNLRIHYQDTSNSASFPTVDWRLVANDTSNGGRNRFSIEDADNGRIPFTIEASAPSNSLYVDDGGRVGLGTATPVVELHVVNGDSPTLRLEQNGSSGFTPQTWDVAGNEAGFFVRDATNGSKLSFRIRPSAPASSIDIQANGDVGIGTSAATAPLHVRRTDGTANLLIEDTSTAATTVQELLTLRNHGGARFDLENTNLAKTWQITNTAAGNFLVTLQASTFSEFTVDQGGNGLFHGTVMGGSDRNRKTDIVPVNAREILSKVSDLPISQWSWKVEDGTRHLGPMAQDFSAAFGLGRDDVTIGLSDIASVGLAAVKGLNEVVQEKDQEIQELKAQNQDMSERLEALEALVQELAAQR